MPDTITLQLSELFNVNRVLELFRALVVLGVGLVVARLASLAIARALHRRVSAQHEMLIRRATAWLITGATVVTVLNHLGFDLGVLIGAAGIFTVAIGFASQTSASNLISGLFLIGERPFVVGDVITVGARTGEVTSIDLLSVKLRTFDNLFVRIPNETLLKTEIINLSYYRIRRVDLTLRVPYDEDLPRVRDTLMRVVEATPLCLDEPKPVFVFQGFQDSAQVIMFGAWTSRENYLEVSMLLAQSIKRAFAEAHIAIPYPQQVLHIAPSPPPHSDLAHGAAPPKEAPR